MVVGFLSKSSLNPSSVGLDNTLNSLWTLVGLLGLQPKSFRAMPSSTINPEVSWAHSMGNLEPYEGPPRNVQFIDAIKLDEKLKPNGYEIHGAHSEAKTLILDAQILDSTGKEPYRGDVLIEGEWPSLRSRIQANISQHSRRALYRSRKCP